MNSRYRNGCPRIKKAEKMPLLSGNGSSRASKWLEFVFSADLARKMNIDNPVG